MNVMDLVKTVAEQEKKIKKYEQKIRDLIEAYKTLSKEKEVLESTVKSLLTRSNNTSHQHKDKDRDKNEEQDSNNQSGMGTNDDQIVQLSNAVATMAEERRKLERNYLEDKRMTRNEYEVNLAALRTELEAQNTELCQLRPREQQARSSLEEMTMAMAVQESTIARLCGELENATEARHNWDQEMVALRSSHEARLAILEGTISDLSRDLGRLEQQHRDALSKLAEKNGNRISVAQDNTAPDLVQHIPHSLVSAEAVGNRDPSSAQQQCGDQCHATIAELTRELECAQLAMQGFIQVNSSVLAAGGSFQHHENERLDAQLSSAKTKIDQLQDELSSLDAGASRTQKTMKETIMKAEWKHKQEVLKIQQSYNQTILDLQSELSKHRNRTMNLLAEKEEEIKSLQKRVHKDKSHQFDTSLEPMNSDEDHETDFSSNRSLTSCPLYQCCEIKARMDQELKGLRQTKRQLLMQIHKLESEIEYIKIDWRNEVGLLTTRLLRAESINKLSSGVNMEYLRNVLIRFLSTSDPSCRLLMATAIGKVLQFSSEELASLNKSSWK